MSEREDCEKLAGELDEQADQLKQRSEALDDEIGEVREDWEHKRADPGVPGAPAPTEESDGDDG